MVRRRWGEDGEDNVEMKAAGKFCGFRGVVFFGFDELWSVGRMTRNPKW